MPGPAPKENSRTRHKPIRGSWQPVPGRGWQHGPVPAPPPGLLKSSRDVWTTWMGSWFASHWLPETLPELYRAIKLYDQVERGEYQRSGESRMAMDGIGATLKGQQDRRWSPPKHEEPALRAEEQPSGGLYEHLRAV